MADTVHPALLLPAPLQRRRLTFTKSQGDRCLTGLEQHAAGQGSGIPPGSQQPRPVSPAAFQQGQGENTTNGEKLKVLLSIAVISDAPAKPGTLVEKYHLKESFLGMQLSERDPGWARGMMHQGGNSSSPANQKDKGENTPLTIQLCKPSLPSPPLHQGMLAGSSSQHPNAPQFQKGQAVSTFSIRAPLAVWVIWSWLHNALANRADSTMRCRDRPPPSPRACSQARARPYCGFPAGPLPSPPGKQGRNPFNFTQNNLGRSWSALLGKHPPKEVLGDLISYRLCCLSLLGAV